MADNAAQSIKDLSKDVEILDQRIEKSIELLQGFDKGIADLFEEARKKGIANTDQLVDYLAKKLNNMQIKTVVSPFLGAFDEKEIDRAARKYASLLEKQNFLEKSRSIAVGGRKFAELRGEDLKNWREFSTLLAAINEQKKQIEQSTPGAAEAGQKLYKEQLAFQKAQEVQEQESRRIAQEKADAKRKAAEDERQLNKEIAEEEKRRTAEAKQRYKEAIDANKSMIKEEEELAKLRREQRTAESKAAFKDYFSKQLNAQKQADRESMNIQRRQIQIKAEMSAIDKKRAADSKQLTAEEKARYREISSELTKLIAKQKELDAISQGSGKRARGKLSKFEISEAEKAMRRYGNAVQDARNKQQGLNNETNKMLPSLQRLASAFGIAFSVRSLAQFGKKLIETRSEFELQQVALRSILQNKQLADEIWDKTLHAALQSPYTAMQLTKYTKQLAAYRIETAKLFDTTKRLADVSAGLGVDMQRLILAYGQVKAANYLRASEIRQFTEAGVNILGELSQYFTEAKGEMVSTAQVMDMVQKRMVKFEDVAEIFKRMTDQGGIFYNMQYIQSQTVKGQLMKLRDAFDQMLNTIGKGNEGTIKNLISLLNNMVRNWREIAGTIKSIGFGAVVGWLSKYAFALTGVTKASVGTLRSMAKLRESVISLGVAFKTNLPLFAIGAVVAGITKLIEMAKRMDAVNKELDEQNMKLYETRQNFEELRYKIQLNNRYIEDATSSEKENTQAKEANRAIMQKLINEYSELAAQMEINENGLINMDKALNVNIRKLNEQMTIVHAMKAQHWFADTDRENLDEWEQSLSIIKTKMLSLQNAAKSRMMLLEREGKIQTKAYEIYEELSRIDLSGNILDAVAAFDKLEARVRRMDIGEINKQLGRQAAAQAGFSYYQQYALSSALGQMPGERDFSWSQNRAIDVLEKQQGALLEFYKNGIRDNAKYLEEINGKTESEFVQWIRDNAGRLNKDTAAGINKANEIFIKTLAPQSEEMKAYLNKYFNDLLGINETYLIRAQARLSAISEQLANRDVEGLGILANPALVALKQEKEFLESLLKEGGINFFAEGLGNGQTPPNFELNAANLRKRVNLLEEMKKRYDELSKSAYGYAKSEEKVRQAFKDSFEEIFKGSGIDMKDIDFTSMEGLSASIQKVLDAATNIKEEVKQEIMKKIDSYEARIEIDAQVRVRENFAREVEKMFSDYELTIDLQKINLPADAAKDLLGLDYTSLSEVMNKITDWRNQQIAKKAYSKDDMKLYETWMKKVTDKMYAMQKEKAKQYTKYLEHELSERAKLEMQYTTDVAFVKANYQDGSQKDMILTNLEKNYSDALNELKWKSFKESSFYVEMMQDLTTMPSEYLNMMMTKLNEWVEKADALSPKALKEVLKAREKIIEAQVAMSPIRALGTSLGGIREVQQEYFLNEDNEEEMFSSNIKEARRQLEGVILAREQNMDLIRQQLDAEESLLGKLTAQENIQRTINELVGKGYEGVGVTSTLDEIQRAIDDNRSLLNAAEPTQAAGESDENFQKRLRQYTEEQAELQGIINLLIELKTQRQQADAMGVDMSQPVSANKEGTLANVRKYKQELDRLEKTQSKDQSRLVYFKQYNTAVHGLAQNIADVTGKVKGVNGAIYNMMDALGETDEITDLWKQFGDAMLDSITNTLNLIPALITGYTAAGVAINSAMGIIGLIAEAIQLTITLITFLVQLSDKQKDKEIENLQKRIDELKNAYERLEKQIEKTWDTSSYMMNYEKMVKNLEDQRKALQAQYDAEDARKNSDEEKMKEYQNSIRDIDETLTELKQKQIEVFGGLGDVNYRSAAQEFVDAWKEAFLETGDGLQGLQDHFDEFLNEWFVKQATMRIAGRMLEPLFREIDNAVDESSQGGANVLLSELQRVRAKFATIAPQLSDSLEQLAGMWGLGEGEGGLSGLAAGIQGMTEEQANILEAHLNSLRGYTASIDMNVSRIADMLGAGSRGITNPQLQQLELIAHNTASIQKMFESVVMSGHTKGQSGIKVFMD